MYFEQLSEYLWDIPFIYADDDCCRPHELLVSLFIFSGERTPETVRLFCQVLVP